ncbi:hypothetical protein [Calothrix sp. UHCC 0171]|uniref:hypothetical protein n=1 Tax=Calothrix sp. UHCC 0171 TaxID=3110245 RepID=UPI002B20FCD0|nr:hypothetical protein [Calothrix sp. UHCC 0171]MEA5572308.1 hypothetical protein [Calothrix sp. UHCC 0171]
MLKLVSATLIATSIIFGAFSNQNVVVAQTCASKCGKRPLQFVPGQLVSIEVTNKTPRLLKLQKIESSGFIQIQPGQTLKFQQTQVTEPNMSLVFWDDTGRALTANLSKPNFATLRVELRPNWYQPGDRSIYLRDDGMVNVL